MKRASLRGWLIWLVVSLFYLYELILRIVPSVIVPDLMHDFSVTATGVGALSVFYYYAYTPIQLPVGLLIDRFGARWQLISACLICVLGTFLFASAHSEALLALSRLLIGLGSAFAWVAVTYLISHWFPVRQRGMLIGLGSSVGLLGGMGGQGPMVLFTDAVGWRPANHTLALCGIVLALLLWLIVRDAPKNSPNPKGPSLTSALKGMRSVALSYQSWLCALFSVLLYLCVSVLAELWGISFLESVHHLTPLEAGCGTSLIYFGMLIGGPLIGLFSDRTHRRKPFMVGGALLSAIALALLIFMSQLSLTLIYVLLFTFGFFLSAQLLSFSLIIELNNPRTKGSALAFNNFITMIGGMVMQPAVGWLLDLSWRGAEGAIRTYSTESFRFALAALPISCLLGALFALFLRETRAAGLDGKEHPFELHSD